MLEAHKAGIYKITSPSGKVYVGKSINIKKRWSQYVCRDCKGQIKLYRSFVKYGVENHIFEILEICDKDSLNKREKYYQEFYNCTGEKGLNCHITQIDGCFKSPSRITREKLRANRLGYKMSEESKRKITESKKKAQAERNRLGIKLSEESRERIRLSNKGRKTSDETKLKLSVSAKGRKHSEESKKRMSEASMGKKMPQIMRDKMRTNNAMSIIVLNTQNGIFYESMALAAESINLRVHCLRDRINGKIMNKTPFIKA